MEVNDQRWGLTEPPGRVARGPGLCPALLALSRPCRPRGRRPECPLSEGFREDADVTARLSSRLSHGAATSCHGAATNYPESWKWKAACLPRGRCW